MSELAKAAIGEGQFWISLPKVFAEIESRISALETPAAGEVEQEGGTETKIQIQESWTSGSLDEWFGDAVYWSPVLEPRKGNPKGKYLQVETNDGIKTAIPGDWICRSDEKGYWVEGRLQEVERLVKGGMADATRPRESDISCAAFDAGYAQAEKAARTELKEARGLLEEVRECYDWRRDSAVEGSIAIRTLDFLTRTKPEEVEAGYTIRCVNCTMRFEPDDLSVPHVCPKPAPKEASGLVEAVEQAMFPGVLGAEPEARAAIEAVADWLEEEQWGGSVAVLRAQLDSK